MIISCPNCNTKFKIKDDLVTPGKTKLKCSKCNHIFIYKEEKEKQEEKKPENEHKVKSTSQSKEEKIQISLEEKPLEKSFKNRRLFVIIIISLIFIVAVAVLFMFTDIKSKIFSSSSHKIKLKSEQNATSQIDAIKDISLENLKQYFIENDKIGKLLVIEGDAVNNFNVPKELIKVEATLYDDKGNVIEKKSILCGNRVSLFQLQSWSKEQLEKELNSKVGILMNNTNIQPGGSVHFMIVFYNPKENVYEYGVRVIEAMDVKEK